MKFNPKKHRVLLPNKQITQAEWNKHLPDPLLKGQKVIVVKDQHEESLEKGYVRVKRKTGVSTFNICHFTTIKGETLTV